MLFGNRETNVHVQAAPHPPSLLMDDTWTKPYSRDYAAFPVPWLRSARFWPMTGEVSHSDCFSCVYRTICSLLAMWFCGLLIRACRQCVWVTATSSALFSQYLKWLKSRLQPTLRPISLLKKNIVSLCLSHTYSPLRIKI